MKKSRPRSCCASRVGDPFVVTPGHSPALVEQLPKFTVALARSGDVVGKGSGRNALRSPALCLGELAAALARYPGAEPLRAGELVSSGTLTESNDQRRRDLDRRS